jgi:hypothetical protein
MAQNVNFPTGPANDSAQSMGQFLILVDPKWNEMMQGYGGYTPPQPDQYWGELESPVLYDDNTIIGLSGEHINGEPADYTGTTVGAAPWVVDTVSDFDFEKLPTGFEHSHDHPEIHTMVSKLLMMPSGASYPRVRAGRSYLSNVSRMSPGEIESHTIGGDDLPGESFFNVFVEVDLHNDGSGADFKGGRIANIGYRDPIVVWNDNIETLPPKVVYIHDTTSFANITFIRDDTSAAQLFDSGDVFGKVFLAGHGFDMNENDDLSAWEDFWWELKMNKPDYPDPVGVPSLTTYGLIVLLLLILLSGISVIYKRKRAVAR